MYFMNLIYSLNLIYSAKVIHIMQILYSITLYIMVLSYLQGKRIFEFYYLLWQCLDNTLKLEINIFNPYICMEIYFTKLTYIVIYRGNIYTYFIIYYGRHEYYRLLGCFSHFGLEYGQPWNMGKILINIYLNKKKYINIIISFFLL